MPIGCPLFLNLEMQIDTDLYSHVGASFKFVVHIYLPGFPDDKVRAWGVTLKWNSIYYLLYKIMCQKPHWVSNLSLSKTDDEQISAST